MSMTLRSDAFDQDRATPRRYSDDGKNLSPPLVWSGLLQDTKELALIVEGPDAPRVEPWIHWVLYKIPADVWTLTEGFSTTPNLDFPPRLRQGKIPGALMAIAVRRRRRGTAPTTTISGFSPWIRRSPLPRTWIRPSCVRRWRGTSSPKRS